MEKYLETSVGKCVSVSRIFALPGHLIKSFAFFSSFNSLRRVSASPVSRTNGSVLNKTKHFNETAGVIASLKEAEVVWNTDFSVSVGAGIRLLAPPRFFYLYTAMLLSPMSVQARISNSTTQVLSMVHDKRKGWYMTNERDCPAKRGVHYKIIKIKKLAPR